MATAEARERQMRGRKHDDEPIDCHIDFDANRDSDHDFVILDGRPVLWVRAVDVRDEREIGCSCYSYTRRLEDHSKVDLFHERHEKAQ